MKLINIGFGNTVSADKVIAIVSPDSAPIKRMVQDAKDNGKNNRSISSSKKMPLSVVGDSIQIYRVFSYDLLN